mmetsp:Transcript_29026/g.38682  ORF Transcript_29026/g.38682 Transcript_29026/m.38682 type:complete len:409 (-) Transcript_29026:211-1437(-)
MFRFITFLVIPTIAILATYVAYLAANDGERLIHQPFGANDIAALSAGKVIVITGASSGLGKSSAKLLAEAGTAQAVVMTCRSMIKCNDTRDAILASIGESGKEGVNLITAELDLESLSSVESFSTGLQKSLAEMQNSGDKNKDNPNENDETAQNVPKIDVLINNAGIMGVEYSLNSQTNVEAHMHVNHLGHFALTSLLRNNLMQGGDNGGRVVTVSSLVGAPPFLNLQDVNFTNTTFRAWILKHSKIAQYLMAYCASKRANLVFTHALNAKYGLSSSSSSSSSAQGITAVAAHPGYSRTSIALGGWAGIPECIKDFAMANTIASMSSDDGALPQLRAALDVEHVRAGDYVGPLFFVKGRPVVVGSAMKSFHHLFSPIREPAKISEELWSWSEGAIGWKFHDGPSKLIA